MHQDSHTYKDKTAAAVRAAAGNHMEGGQKMSEKESAGKKEKVLKEIMQAVKEETGMDIHITLDGTCWKTGKKCILAGVSTGKDETLNALQMDYLTEECLMDGSIKPPQAASLIAKACRRHLTEAGMLQHAAEDTLVKDTVLKKVLYRPVRRAGNDKMLMETPHKDFLDLAAIYRIPISSMHGSEFSLVIQNPLCCDLNISHAELDAAARKNTEKESFLAQPLPFSGDGNDLYEILGKHMVYGSNALLFPDFFENIARILHDDLYVMAFNVHQLIAGPAAGRNPDILAQEAYAIGHTGIPPEYFLSDSLYRYERTSGRLEIAASPV